MPNEDTEETNVYRFDVINGVVPSGKYSTNKLSQQSQLSKHQVNCVHCDDAISR
jgi:hypothetical protein